MNEIQIFNHSDFGQVRTINENGNVLFCGNDVANALGYAVPRKALFDHCKGVLKRNILTNGGEQEMSFIPESDLYRLVFRSKLPSAEKFTDWVTSEVLPSIRKHGAYMTPETLQAAILNPDTMIQLCQQLKAEQDKNHRLQVINSRLTVDNWHRVYSSMPAPKQSPCVKCRLEDRCIDICPARAKWWDVCMERIRKRHWEKKL